MRFGSGFHSFCEQIRTVLSNFSGEILVFVKTYEDGYYKTGLRGGVYWLNNRFNEDYWTDFDQNLNLEGSGGFLFAPIN